ncbi:Disease resistance protein RPP2B [Linum grandiflorum]
MSIVIFSDNFSESSYCLDEVATIAERLLKFGHRVLPIFYKVKPENVINWTCS